MIFEVIMKWILLTLALSTQAFSFTLNNNFGAAFKKNRVNIYIDRNTTCSGMTVYELQDLISPAIDNFWNKVATSSLKLNAAGFNDTTVNNINDGRLCAPTDSTCLDDATANGEDIVAPVDEIIIACNNLNTNFGNSGTVLAVTVPNHFAGKKIAGSVILINSAGSSVFFSLSREDKISVLAHEIGHAIGLGHAENKHDDALMYYRTINHRKALGQDDVDGVSYLYPQKMDGCGLFSGTINEKKGPPFWQMGATLGLMILLVELLKLLRGRPKTQAPL